MRLSWRRLRWAIPAAFPLVLALSAACATPEVPTVEEASTFFAEEHQAVTYFEVSEFAGSVDSVRYNWLQLQGKVRDFVGGVGQQPPIFQDYLDENLVRALVTTDDLSDGGLLSRIAEAQKFQASVKALSAEYLDLRSQVRSLLQHDQRMERIADTYAVGAGFEQTALAMWADSVVFGDGRALAALTLWAEAANVIDQADTDLDEFLADTRYMDQAVTASTVLASASEAPEVVVAR